MTSIQVRLVKTPARSHQSPMVYTHGVGGTGKVAMRGFDPFAAPVKAHTQRQRVNISKLCLIPAVPAAATQRWCQEDALAPVIIPGDSLAPMSLGMASPLPTRQSCCQGQGEGMEQAGLDLGGSGCSSGAQDPMCLRWPPSTVAGLGVAGGFARRWHCLAANHAGGPNLDSGMEVQMYLLPKPRPGASPGTPEGKKGQGQRVFAAGSYLPAKPGGVSLQTAKPCGLAAARGARCQASSGQHWGGCKDEGDTGGVRSAVGGSGTPWCHLWVSCQPSQWPPAPWWALEWSGDLDSAPAPKAGAVGRAEVPPAACSRAWVRHTPQVWGRKQLLWRLGGLFYLNFPPH